MDTKQEKMEMGDFDKSKMASADDSALDFYGIQKGDMSKMAEEKEPEASEEQEASEDELSKMMYKMMEQGLSKMMEDDDSSLSKMMYKMMRKMIDDDKEDEDVSEDQMELPGMSKAIEVVEETATVETPARGRDALMGWLNK